MASDIEVWKPGSFTKNYGWGPRSHGLKKLHEVIRLGFQNDATDVVRSQFRERVGHPDRDYVPLNFFLFNRTKNGTDFVAYDELVFQAQNFRPSADFDRLALFAFNLSEVGRWRGARPGQDRPALWANAYMRERVAGSLQWDTAKISKADIEGFLVNDPRYQAKTSSKVSTNLVYLYLNGRLSEFGSPKVSRWWVNALFLALDRFVMARAIRGLPSTLAPEQLSQALATMGFISLTGPKSLEKQLAVKHLVHLYSRCGGIERFSDDAVRELTAVSVPDMDNYIANDGRPGAAVHNTNPAILKTIPRACAMLAKHAGFEFLDADDLRDFDVDEFVKRKAAAALELLQKQGINATMSVADLMRITRSE